MADEDQWYGVFQGYRPHGDGVEALFVGVPDAAEYVERLRAVCRAAYHDDWARDGYFVLRHPQPASDEELVTLGRELLGGLRVVALLASLSGDRELLSYLTTVSDIAIVPLAEFDHRSDDNMVVHQTIGDILRGLSDYGHRIVQLREGFYSVACDPWLAAYLQWPYFREWIPPDVFRPYFELWRRGRRVAFRADSLCLTKDVV